MKIGDLDARGERRYCFTISDKSLAIAGGVIEAILTERWNAIVETVDDLELSIDALKTELAIARGEDQFERLTPQEIEEWLGDDALPG